MVAKLNCDVSQFMVSSAALNSICRVLQEAYAVLGKVRSSIHEKAEVSYCWGYLGTRGAIVYRDHTGIVLSLVVPYPNCKICNSL